MHKKITQTLYSYIVYHMENQTPDCMNDITEPLHDKTNKMSLRPAKTQISLGIHLV